MRKTILFAAAAALLSLVACNKNSMIGEQPETGGFQVQNAITFANAAQTRGYAVDGTFYDTAIAELHAGEAGAPSDVKTPRDMQISAYLTPQNGDAGNYFVDYTYKKGSDNLWHHDPAIYWPIAGKLDFLAYSAKEAFDPKDVAWDENNASDAVVLNVLENRTQDDILFCSAANKASSAGATAVAMNFKHAQAWIEFQIKMSDAEGKMDGQLAIESIVLENVYTTGELTITNNSGDAQADWNFRKEVAKDVVVDDNYNFYGSQKADFSLEKPITKDLNYLDMLIPEQAKSNIVINYVLAGQPNKLSYRFELPSSANWVMGEKYIYAIEFTTNEITVAPTVKAYENGVVSDVTGSFI